MTQRFSERYVLARIRDEGILLDLETGSYFAVRGSALATCRALTSRASVSAAAASLANEFEVSRKTASRDIATFLASLGRRRRSLRTGIFRARPAGFELRGARGVSLVLAVDGEVLTRDASSHLLRAAAPHVLALRGEIVLHASAIVHRGASIAFVAASGTGKTTIAALLEKCGRRVLSEDLVALDRDLRVRHDGERAVRAWAESRAHLAHPLAQSKGPTSPLAAVMLVERVEGLDRARIERAQSIAGMASLFENAFIELPVPHVWARALDVSRKLVARRIVYTMQVPEGRRALSRAVRDWSDRGFPRS